ncbi:MAG TPA: hypothetical protein VKZ81_11070 [Pseudonocardia sp.]|jgi:hypothetical protein|uniref:hypothetical protein n=1 Tax=Pseudonocardia sp. TaxID=60912 RepID=UPI002B4AC4FD|nr:hypothetical protein [Pseudonocardia sp.]HLU55992.1 hypothetical protein [Pseudonocardia sp.]
MTITSPWQPSGSAQSGPERLKALWKWLTTCDAEGCAERPVHLGWCARHAPAYDPGPDEYWGDEETDQPAV